MNYEINHLFNDPTEFAVIDMTFIYFCLNFDTLQPNGNIYPRLGELYAVHKKLNHSPSDSQ